MAEDKIEKTGTVVEKLPNSQCRVEMDNGEIILGIPKGKLKMNNIGILPGDRVVMKISPYDVTKGYITQRL